MLGLSGLAQSAVAALPPAGTPPLSSVRNGTTLLTRQEMPDHPSSRFWGGVVAANVEPFATLHYSIFTTQEQPSHPRSNFWSGVQGPNVAPPVTAKIIIRQEQPGHPPSFLWSGRQQTGNVRPVVSDTVMVRQEQPWHPRPGTFLWSAPPPVPPSNAFIQPLITRQQAPWHPSSFFHAGTAPIAFEDVQFFVIH